MRSLILFLGMVSFSLSLFAGNMRTELVKTSTGETTFDCASGSTVYTNSFPLKSAETLTVGYKVTSSASTPKTTIQFQGATSLPATEGSTDDDWVTPDSMADVATDLTSETQHYKGVTLQPLPYGRFKVVDAGATDTKVTLSITTQE